MASHDDANLIECLLIIHSLEPFPVLPASLLPVLDREPIEVGSKCVEVDEACQKACIKRFAAGLVECTAFC